MTDRSDLLKLPVRLLVPPVLRRWLKRQWMGDRYTPVGGTVRFGDLRRVTPVGRNFGHDRGLPVDRHFIEKFLGEFRSDIHGRVLEIGDRAYTRRFGGDQVAKSDVLHAVAGNPEANIVGDLQTGENVPAGVYDCVILTQGLNVIFDFRGALRHAVGALKPGGVLLLTVPAITQMSVFDVEHGWGDHWRFTALSITRLLEELVPAANVSVREYGNVLAAVSFLHGLAAAELTGAELDFFDREFTMIIGARAEKPR